MKTPDYIFETSWEVCNKIGGIYAVLSTRAASMQQEHKDKVFFIGPDLADKNVAFKQSNTLLADWQKQARKEGLQVRVGRWLVPGKPIAVLINFSNFWEHKNNMYSHNWQRFQVNSIAAYGDYDESCVFAYSTGVVMESIYHFYHLEDQQVVAHFNEWTTSFGLFYIKEHLPKVGTLFTTHATSIGRSIAGNNKPLYDYFGSYYGDQMAQELNMVSKHSAEKTAAREADCFTTVSELTNQECKQLLEKAADIVTPNGFESDFMPKTEKQWQQKRSDAQMKLREVASAVLGYELPHDSLFVCTSGRYEWKNKGIDAFLFALNRLRSLPLLHPVVAFIMVPAWQKGAHEQLGRTDHITTHQLVDPQNDPIIGTMRYLGYTNSREEQVKVIFVPSYLTGDDGIFNMPYYDLLIGMDASVFPSYYEPWGYTPLESIAFRVPTITTTLAGFGLWAKPLLNKPNKELVLWDFLPAQYSNANLERGVVVLKRNDSNFSQLTELIATNLQGYINLQDNIRRQAQKNAAELAAKADWKHFFEYYRQAYNIALTKANER